MYGVHCINVRPHVSQLLCLKRHNQESYHSWSTQKHKLTDEQTTLGKEN